MKYSIMIFLIPLLTIACGPSDEEIKKAAMRDMKLLIEQKGELSGQIEQLQNTIAENKAAYEDLVAQIVAEESRLKDIQQFRLLRSSAEKERQIKDQVKYIRQLETRKPEFEQTIQKQEQTLSLLQGQLNMLDERIERP